jgi:hypothetical protein
MPAMTCNDQWQVTNAGRTLAGGHFVIGHWDLVIGHWGYPDSVIPYDPAWRKTL